MFELFFHLLLKSDMLINNAAVFPLMKINIIAR